MSERITFEETEDSYGLPMWRILNESDVVIGSISFDRNRDDDWWVAFIGGIEVASSDTLTGAAMKIQSPYIFDPATRQRNNVVSIDPSNQSDGRHTPASTPDDSSTASHSFWSAVKRPFSVLSSRIRVRRVVDSTKSGKPTLL